MVRLSCVAALLLTSVAASQFGTYLTEKPRVSLEEALPIASLAARAKVPDLDKFVLNSVKPCALKNDTKGEHWQFRWQELLSRWGCQES